MSCYIREVTIEDLPMVLSWRNHPDVRRFMLTQHTIDLDEHRDWFEKANNDPMRQLLIVEEKTNPLGYVQFSNVSSGGISDWGFYARPDASKGTGTKLGVTALNYAFEKLDIHKVCGQAIAYNMASISFHDHLGFAQEGVLREQCYIDDTYYDLICFGLLKSDWQTSNKFQDVLNAKD